MLTESTAETAVSQPGAKRQNRKRIGLTPYSIPILIVHVLALTALIPWCFSWTGLVVCLVGVLVYGQGINLGYHRLLTHRSLTVPKWLERAYVILAMCCMEESPAKWVSTHRLHHAHSDEAPDPHSPTYTFFWAHMGWLVVKRPDRNQLGVHLKYANDILRDRFYIYLESAWWFGIFLFAAQMTVYYLVGLVTGLALGWELAAAIQFGTSLMVWGVLLRIVLVWHLTWSVNSLAHVFGYRNYDTTDRSRNNWLVAMLASGEGWHNNHHHDQASASVQHRWWEFDVTYYQIWMLEKMGLAKNVVRPRHVRHREREAAQQRDSKLDINREDRSRETTAESQPESDAIRS